MHVSRISSYSAINALFAIVSPAATALPWRNILDYSLSCASTEMSVLIWLSNLQHQSDTRLSTCTWGFDPQEETAKTVARQKARSSFASETNVIEVLGSLKWSTGACDKIWASNSLKQSEHYTQHWNKTQVHTKLFCRPSWTQMISSVSKEFMNASWSEYVAGWKCYFFLNSFLYQ